MVRKRIKKCGRLPLVCYSGASWFSGKCGWPRVFLAKGKEIDLASFRDFANNFPAPVGSHVEMTPNAYMTDDAWRNICPKLCQGIRAMKGVLDNCWVVFSLDGFGSHLDAESFMVFHANKILVIKDEGDTSQVCQAYDQIVAKEDKRRAGDILDMIKLYKKTMINQWELIVIINEA